MPRFFFNLADGSEHRDAEGIELPSVDEARREAIVYAGETLQHEPYVLWDGKEFKVEVEDASGRVLFVLKVSAEAPNDLK